MNLPQTHAVKHPNARSKTRHRRHANPLAMFRDVPQPNWSKVFPRQAPMALEIGFGPGYFLLELAAAHPEWNIIGIEIRSHLVEETQHVADKRGLTNVHLLQANANLHLDTLIEDNSLVFTAVNFPDPWFKRSHQKRRVINKEWLNVIDKKLIKGGDLHIMTDFQPIGQEAAQLLATDPRFTPKHQGLFAENTTTGFHSDREVCHIKRGDPIYRMHYQSNTTIVK